MRPVAGLSVVRSQTPSTEKANPRAPVRSLEPPDAASQILGVGRRTDSWEPNLYARWQFLEQLPVRIQLLHLSGPYRGQTITYTTEKVLFGTASDADAEMPKLDAQV